MTETTEKILSRVWLITGSSTGFGRCLAEAALAQGDRVIATARKIGQIKYLEKKYPKTAKAIYLDVTEKESIQSAVNSGLEAFGKIDVLVNNAGYGLVGTIEEANEKQIRNQFETNVFGVLNVTCTILPIFRKQRSGHILNISSLAGRLAVPTMGIYSGSKHALEGISESLACEVKSFGIKVIIIEPGGFVTDFSSRSQVSSAPMPEYDFLRKEADHIRKNYTLGDTANGVQAMLEVVKLPDPPLRLAIGPGCQPRLIKKLSADIEEYKQYEEIWKTSTGSAKSSLK